MLITFGVAVAYHRAGADASDLLPERFATYDEAYQFSRSYIHECDPTIYVIYNNEYAFYCSRSACKNEPYRIYHLKSFDGGQIQTSVWWEDFVNNPRKYLHLGQKIA